MSDRLESGTVSYWAMPHGQGTKPAMSTVRSLAREMQELRAQLDAIDAVLVTYSAGPPEMAPLLDDLYRILHPEEGDQ